MNWTETNMLREYTTLKLLNEIVKSRHLAFKQCSHRSLDHTNNSSKLQLYTQLQYRVRNKAHLSRKNYGIWTPQAGMIMSPFHVTAALLRRNLQFLVM